MLVRGPVSRIGVPVFNAAVRLLRHERRENSAYEAPRRQSAAKSLDQGPRTAIRLPVPQACLTHQKAGDRAVQRRRSSAHSRMGTARNTGT